MAKFTMYTSVMKSFISFELYVRDIDDCTNFFVSVFGATKGYEDEGFVVVWLGHTRLALNKLNLKEFEAPNPVLKEGALSHLGAGLEIVLSVENFDYIHEQVERRIVRDLTPVVDRPWGLRDFRFLLDDGYYIRVTEADVDIRRVW